MAMLSTRSSSESGSITIYECKICHRTFGTKIEAERHIANTHPEAVSKVYTCAKCKMKFSTKEEAENHLKSRHPEIFKNIYRCRLCNKEFSSKKAIENHFKTYHKEISQEKITCPICGMEFGLLEEPMFLAHLEEKHPDLFAKLEDLFRDAFCSSPSKDKQKLHDNEEPPSKAHKPWWKFWSKA